MSGCDQSYSFSCGSNYSSNQSYGCGGGYQSFESHNCGSYTSSCSSGGSSSSCSSEGSSSGCSGYDNDAQQACYNQIESYKSEGACTYSHSHHSGCGGGSHTVSVVAVALQDAANIGAGVQGDVGCTVDACGQPQPPHLCDLPVGTTDGTLTYAAGTSNTTAALANGDGDSITVASGDSNTMVTGNGAADSIILGTGDDNTLVVGDGAGDKITLTKGDGNILVAGNGDGDVLTVGSQTDGTIISNGNTLVEGNGAGDTVLFGTGDSNAIFVGNGANDFIVVNTGDSNAVIVGSGDGDNIFLGTGTNNDLNVGGGAGDQILVLTGDNNCVTAGNGAGDMLSVSTGNSNDIEAGNGAGDQLIVDSGDNNLLKAGNGAGDFLTVSSGDHNTLSASMGDNDILLVGTGNYNLLEALCSGSGDVLQVSTGNFNALIAGNGDGDSVIVGTGNNNIMAVGDGNHDTLQLMAGDSNTILEGNGLNDLILVGGTMGTSGGMIGTTIDSNNGIAIGNGNGDEAFGALGNNNSYITGAGNDLVHTGGGNDFVYEDNHTETATPLDPFHLTSTDSDAQNWFADSGSDTFALQGTVENSCQSYSQYNVGCGHTAQTVVTYSQECRQVGASDPGLGTTVITGHDANANLAAGTTGAEKYWVSGLWGSLVITDFNSADGDRIMMGGVSDPNISSLGAVHFQYINSAYDSASTGSADLDLLITFGAAQNAPQQSIELLDYKPQDTGGVGGTMLFNNVTFNDPQAAEAALSHIFDFSAADNAAVTSHIASLASQNLILH